MAVPEDQARTELIELFKSAVADHPDVMAECLSVLRMYNLLPSTLFYKYEAFLLSRPSGLRAKLSVLTVDTVRELRNEIQREHQAKAVAGAASATMHGEATPKAVTSVRKGKGNMGDLGGFLDGLTTPSRPSKSRNGIPPGRLSNTSNNANVRSPPAHATPQGSFATPLKPSPAGDSSSSYRPGPQKLAPPSTTRRPDSPSNRGQYASAPSSPVSGGESSHVLTPQPTQPFKQRPQPNSLVETLNPHLPASRPGATSSSTKPRVALSSTADPKNWAYRYMFEKISQRSEALDELIDDFAEMIRDAYGITEFGDPHFVSDDAIYTVGRVMSPPTDSAKVAANSLFLESSRLLGSGKRVALKFPTPAELKVRGGAPGVKGFGLFPGCLICVKGRNGGGGFFVVEEVLLSPPSALPQTPAQELLEYQHEGKLAGSPMSLMVAAGPYTLDDDLLYEPLEALMEVVIDEKPDVLILLGPFVDSNHPSLLTGAIHQMPADIFRDQISARLQRIIDTSPSTAIVLIPSTRDVVNWHIAYPQAMLDKELLGIPKKIKSLPNPCTFSINEVVISLNSVDVLFHLRREEVFQRAEEAEPDPTAKSDNKDSMAGLVRHVLGQRSFYPIFPPSEGNAAEVNLDVTHYSLLRLDGPAPDVLILPSKLKHFSKFVDSTLVLNPAHLSRPHSAGTFAKMLIHPTPREELEKAMDEGNGLEGYREHGLWERARSEIWRI